MSKRKNLIQEGTKHLADFNKETPQVVGTNLSTFTQSKSTAEMLGAFKAFNVTSNFTRIMQGRIIEEFKLRHMGGMRAALEQFSGNALEQLHRVISFNSRFAVENQDLCVFLTFLTTELNADVDFEPALKGAYLEYRKVGVSEDVRRTNKGISTKTGRRTLLISWSNSGCSYFG